MSRYDEFAVESVKGKRGTIGKENIKGELSEKRGKIKERKKWGGP